MKWDDGTPKLMNNGFTRHLWDDTPSVAASLQIGHKNSTLTSEALEARRKMGYDVRAVNGMGADWVTIKGKYQFKKANI